MNLLVSDCYRGAMTEGAQHSGEEPPPVKWLTGAELDSWLSLVRLMTWLPWSIDQQLRRDSNLGMVEYQVLAMLSESPGRTMRMSSLAEVTNASLSRLSHLFKRLEQRGLGECLKALVGQDGISEPAVSRIRLTAHQASCLKALDQVRQPGQRRVGEVGERAHPQGPLRA